MKLPISTYRLQLNKEFDFYECLKILPYLSALGISTLYLSPILMAEPGSSHGYNVINPNKINPELENKITFKKLSKYFARYNLNIILDIVPNHMSATKNNQWFNDAVTKKDKSCYKEFFDIKEINNNKIFFRRFFDINELICVNNENLKVVNYTHKLIKKLAKLPFVLGFRIDHVDGLIDPDAYLKWFKDNIAYDKYIIVEKVLAKEEKINKIWPIQGTTGYDFLNYTNNFFINDSGFYKILGFYKKEINEISIGEIKRLNYLMVIDNLFYQDLEYLIYKLSSLLKSFNIEINDSQIKEKLINISSCISVYRSYINAWPIKNADKKIIFKLFNHCKFEPLSAYLILKKIFLCQINTINKKHIIKRCIKFIQSWQVFTASMVAKGFEDTTCYQYNPCISLNEVGSSEGFFNELSNLKSFINYNKFKKNNYPFSLNTTSTHDTKRSEDNRARINVLTELADKWIFLFREWHKLNSNHREFIDNRFCPDPNEEFFIYQSLIGSWPLYKKEFPNFKKRFLLFMIKAIREAKIHSNWTNPNIIYEKSIKRFCKKILDKNNYNFHQSFEKFFNKISFHGMLNSLEQVILKNTLPGIPDYYQGSELWLFDLVDPDNRRKINFEIRKKYLQQIQKNINNKQFLGYIKKNWKNGQIKQYIIYVILVYKNQFPDLFIKGSFSLLKVQGKFANNIFAFIRKFKSQLLIVIILKNTTKIIKKVDFKETKIDWGDTHIVLNDAKQSYRSLITNTILHFNNTTHQKIFLKECMFDLPFEILVK